MLGTESHRPDMASAEANVAIGQIRIAIGFLQGITAWLLLRLVPPAPYAVVLAKGTHLPYWSERHPLLFAALALITAYVPVIALLEIARMRRRRLSLYMAATSAILAGLAAYDIWRDPIEHFGTNGVSRIWPSFAVSFCAALGLFIVNQLLEHRERGHSLFERYADHFEDSWMRGFQLILSLIFTLLVWGVLELGAGLFNLIHIGWFETMIGHNWFRCPVLAMAFAAAIHITDVRPTLLRGMRNVGLTLLSWLLPLIVTLAAAFLLALLFVGLKPLWATRYAASILLWTCAITLLLLNAAYKDGDPAALPSTVLRWAGRLAGPVMLFLVLLACYAIALRVHQYGWTPERVRSTAIAAIGLVYSLGYTRAAVQRASWLTPLERVNVCASLLILAILICLLTPLADPARLSVNSQLRRLMTGSTAPGKFDYQFLRFDSGRFGTHALDRLAQGTDEDVRSRAQRIQAMSSRTFVVAGEDERATEAAFTHAKIYPPGAHLPEDFRSSKWTRSNAFNFDCLYNGGSCDLYLVAHGAAADMAVLVRSYSGKDEQSRAYGPSALGGLFQRDATGKWVYRGTFNHMDCVGVVAALREGSVRWARPEHDDLMVDGFRLDFSAAPQSNPGCTSAPEPHVPDKAQDSNAPAHMGPAFGHP